MKNALLALLLLAAPAFPSAMAQAADAPRKARVATGAEVTLVTSARSPAQWTALRPKVRNLRPRVRGTFD
jgi:hypothetical protein